MKVNKSIRGKLYTYFRDRLDLKPSTKGFLRGDCPFCFGKFCFGVNIYTNKINCFKDGCSNWLPGQANPLLELVCKLEDFTEIEEARKLIDVRQEYELRDIKTTVKSVKSKVTLPESFAPIWEVDGSRVQKAAHYYVTKKRKIPAPRAMYAGIGYCSSGPYAGYIIFPIYAGGELVFYQGRLFMGNGPKMNNPPEEQFGVGKTEVLYNQDALYIYNRVYIVESIINALTMGEAGVATLGKSISQYQLMQLLKCPCEVMIILYDPDALKKAVELALALVNYKRVKLVYWDGDKDVNDLGKKEVLKRVKAQDYQTYRELLNIKINLKE